MQIERKACCEAYSARHKNATRHKVIWQRCVGDSWHDRILVMDWARTMRGALARVMPAPFSDVAVFLLRLLGDLVRFCAYGS